MSMTGPILTGLRGTKIMGFISYTLVRNGTGKGFSGGSTSNLLLLCFWYFRSYRPQVLGQDVPTVQDLSQPSERGNVRPPRCVSGWTHVVETFAPLVYFLISFFLLCSSHLDPSFYHTRLLFSKIHITVTLLCGEKGVITCLFNFMYNGREIKLQQ
jgi:hypothetical protein